MKFARNKFNPPLRLIITTECNGKCYYCHKEGCRNHLTDMPEKLILECFKLMKYIRVPHLSLSGGEPTLRSDLANIINKSYKLAPDIKIKLTSNGLHLLDVGKDIKNKIYEVNLSIASLDYKINSKYQNVDPQYAFDGIIRFPAIHKKVNVVVTTDNLNEVTTIIEYCVSKSISIDLIFELKNYSPQELNMQSYIFKQLRKIGKLQLILDYVPTLSLNLGKCTLRIKHPFLSSLINREICINCPYISKCYERICAVRVYPNAFVTPCLNQYICSNEDSFLNNVKEVYNKISDVSPISNQVLNKKVTTFLKNMGVYS